MPCTTYLVRNIGSHGGTPRVYLDLPLLADAGFEPGKTYRRTVDGAAKRITLSLEPNGSYVVSGKTKGDRRLPVIDISSAEALKPFEGMEAVRIVVGDKTIHILPLASEVRRTERLERLARNLDTGKLETAGLCFGGGVLDHASHSGLQDAGIHPHLALANELDEELLMHAREHNDTIARDTTLMAAPMQELVQDDWAMRQLRPVDTLCIGIPCSGASRAGRAKRGLGMMEDHPTVGHLVASAIMLIQRLNPAVIVLENVVPYKSTASAQILRQHLRDSGYTIEEVTLNAADFGCLEARERWFMVAATAGLPMDLQGLAPVVRPVRTVAEILDKVPDDSPEWRTFDYLKTKQLRDQDRGNCFRMQVVTPSDTSVPSLRKGYNRGGTTDPLLAHPSDPDRLRLFTLEEHARIKGVPPHLHTGMGRVAGHEMLGQGIAYEPVRALFKRIGQCLLNWRAGVESLLPRQQLAYSLKAATG